jgi:hypothetical protein
VKSVNDIASPLAGEKRKAAEMEGLSNTVLATPQSEQTVVFEDWSQCFLAKLAKCSSESLFDIADENVKELARFLADSCPPLDFLMDVSVTLPCDNSSIILFILLPDLSRSR